MNPETSSRARFSWGPILFLVGWLVAAIAAGLANREEVDFASVAVVVLVAIALIVAGPFIYNRDQKKD